MRTKSTILYYCRIFCIYVIILTSKPSQPQCGTFKPDLAVFVNLDLLITNLLSFFTAVASLSSTSASKFEFIETGLGRVGGIATLVRMTDIVIYAFPFVFAGLTPHSQ